MEQISQITQMDSVGRGRANLRHLRNQRHRRRLFDGPVMPEVHLSELAQRATANSLGQTDAYTLSEQRNPLAA